jgi:hypothetical protein
MYGGEETGVENFGGKTEEKKPLRRSRRILEDSFIMDHTGIRREDVEWTNLAQGKDKRWVCVNTVIKILVPYIRKEYVRIQRRTVVHILGRLVRLFVHYLLVSAQPAN